MSWLVNGLFIKSKNLLASQSTNLYYNNVRGEHSKLDGGSHRVNKLEKKFLVWTGKYKSVDEVPAFVQQNVVERARNRMRIKISNYMMAATAVACVIMVILGKRAAGRGESVAQQNMEWHRQVKEEANKKN